MKKRESFKIPEDYFEHTKARLKSIAQEQPVEPSSRVIQLQKYYWASLAAAAVLVLAFFIWPTGEGSPGPTQVPALSQIESEALLDYLNTNTSLNEFNYFIVEEEYLEEDFNLDDDEMMDYLESQPLDFYNL